MYPVSQLGFKIQYTGRAGLQADATGDALVGVYQWFWPLCALEHLTEFAFLIIDRLGWADPPACPAIDADTRINDMQALSFSRNGNNRADFDTGCAAGAVGCDAVAHIYYPLLLLVSNVQKVKRFQCLAGRDSSLGIPADLLPVCFH